jgi:hypothetical protein
MAELHVALTAEERQCLVEVLEEVLKNLRVEEHRTRTPTYREGVLQRENLINSAIGKLRQAGK